MIYGEGNYLPTCSLFYRKDVSVNSMLFQKYWDIDYTTQIRGALRGGIVFIPNTMAVYRWQTEGSWTVTNNDIDKQLEFYRKRQKMLEILDGETQGEFFCIINKRKKRNEFDILLKQEKNREAISGIYKEFFAELDKGDKIRIILKACFPKLSKIYQRIRRKTIYG